MAAVQLQALFTITSNTGTALLLLPPSASAPPLAPPPPLLNGWLREVHLMVLSNALERVIPEGMAQLVAAIPCRAWRCCWLSNVANIAAGVQNQRKVTRE